MCLVIATWDGKTGAVASEGRMMKLAAPVAFGPVTKTVAADDCFKVHRLTPSLIVGIIGWAHVTDDLLACLRAELLAYDEPVVTAHMVRLKEKYPAAALQVVLMGIQDGRVHAATWSDADPSRCYSPTHPANRPKTIVLGDSDIAGEALAMVRRGTPLQDIFAALAQKHATINDRVHTEEIYAYST